MFPEIRQAVQLSEQAAYTEGELAAYDKYCGAVSTEKTLLIGAREEGREEGREAGTQTTKESIAKNLLTAGFDPEKVAALTGLTLAEVAQLI